MKRAVVMSLVLAGLGLTGGCTAEHYQRSADQQVQSILRERKQQTLGYQPESVAEVKTNPAPSADAYKKIPTSPVPPPQIPPMEPSQVHIPYGPLGPPEHAPATSEESSQFGIDAAEQHATDRLTLGPPNPGPKPARLDLFKAIQYATQHAHDYADNMESLYSVALDVTLQRHLFEPRPFADAGLNYAGGQHDAKYRSALTATGDVGVRQQLPYGGEVVAETLVKFIDQINGHVANGETAQVALTASVPLLRGAGMVNLEPLIASERKFVYQVRSFEDYRRQFAVNIARAYFNLLTSQQSVINRRLNYIGLLSLTQRTEALYIASRTNFLFVQRAYQAQLQAEADLINAQVAYEASLDSFKLLIGMPTDQDLEVVPISIDLHPPDIDHEDSGALALCYRLDLKTAEDQVEDARRAVCNAKNGLLPDLTLTASADLGNRTGTPAKSLDDRNVTYAAGLTFGFPLDRVSERNIFRRSLIALEHAQRAWQLLRDQILSDVHDSLRQIRSAQVALEIQRRGIELARRRVEYANELLKIGQADSRDVVDAETSLLSAQDSYNSALSSLQIQVLQYLRNTGMLRVDESAGTLGYSMNRAAVRTAAAAAAAVSAGGDGPPAAGAAAANVMVDPISAGTLIGAPKTIP